MQKKIGAVLVVCTLLVAFSTKGASSSFDEIVGYKGAGYDLRNLTFARKLHYYTLTLLPEGPEKAEKLAMFFSDLRPFATHCRGGNDPEWKDCEWEGDVTWGGRRHPWGGACECGSYDPSNPTDDPRVWEKKMQDFSSAKTGLEMLLNEAKELSEQKRKDEIASEKAAHQLMLQLEREQVVSKLIEAYQTICTLKADIQVEKLLDMIKDDFEVADYQALEKIIQSTLTQEMGIALLKLRMMKKE